jgi:hypothetical protein
VPGTEVLAGETPGAAAGRAAADWLGTDAEIVRPARTAILAYDFRPWPLARRIARAR